VEQKEMPEHVAAHILRNHIPPNAYGFCGVCGTPPTLVAKTRGMQAVIQCGSGQRVTFMIMNLINYQSVVAGGACSNGPTQRPYPPCYCGRTAWRIIGLSHTLIMLGQRLSASARMSVSCCRSCHDHCCCCRSLTQLFYWRLNPMFKVNVPPLGLSE
jgi:hypothetical protein